MALSRNRRGKQAAVKAAYLSGLYKLRVGAALFNGNRLVSLGWNCKKTHPNRNTELSQHAEFNVFIGIKRSLIVGCDLYIARITRTSAVKMSKPCKDCQEFLKALPLGKIFYTNDDGKIERFRWGQTSTKLINCHN